MKTLRLAGVVAAALLAASLTAHAAEPAKKPAAAAAAKPRAPNFQDHYAQNGAVKIHYVTAGDPNKPLVVMIHGFPDNW